MNASYAAVFPSAEQLNDHSGTHYTKTEKGRKIRHDKLLAYVFVSFMHKFVKILLITKNPFCL
jgi:hypothetical protein